MNVVATTRITMNVQTAVSTACGLSSCCSAAADAAVQQTAVLQARAVIAVVSFL